MRLPNGVGGTASKRLSTLPGLPEPWTRKRTRAHNSLDAAKRPPTPTAPWKTGHTDAGFPQRQQAAPPGDRLLVGRELR